MYLFIHYKHIYLQYIYIYIYIDTIFYLDDKMSQYIKYKFICQKILTIFTNIFIISSKIYVE